MVVHRDPEKFSVVDRRRAPVDRIPRNSRFDLSRGAPDLPSGYDVDRKSPLAVDRVQHAVVDGRRGQLSQIVHQTCVPDRHKALEQGEANPDYIFFGKLEGDIKPEPHPKNVALGEWWASMIEIPCVVMGGTDPSSVVDVALAGVEFVALREAIFADPTAVTARVAEVNALLDEKAPRFEEC